MALKLGINAADGYVLVEHYGVTDVNESIQAGQEALNLVMEHNLLKVFIDVTGIVGMLSIIDLFRSTKYHAEHASIKPKAVLYGRPDQKQELSFIETVGVNRGMFIKTFTGRDEALAWLLGK